LIEEVPGTSDEYLKPGTAWSYPDHWVTSTLQVSGTQSGHLGSNEVTSEAYKTQSLQSGSQPMAISDQC
jgi:hypothetical protein